MESFEAFQKRTTLVMGIDDDSEVASVWLGGQGRVLSTIYHHPSIDDQSSIVPSTVSVARLEAGRSSSHLDTGASTPRSAPSPLTQDFRAIMGGTPKREETRLQRLNEDKLDKETIDCTGIATWSNLVFLNNKKVLKAKAAGISARLSGFSACCRC